MSQQLNRFYKLSTGLYLGRENSRVRGKLSTRTKLDHQHEPNCGSGCGREEFLIFWFWDQDEAQTGGQERPVSYDLLLIKLLYLAWRCNENIQCQSVSRPIYLTVYCTIALYSTIFSSLLGLSTSSTTATCAHLQSRAGQAVPSSPSTGTSVESWHSTQEHLPPAHLTPQTSQHDSITHTTLTLTTCVWLLVSNK